MTFEEIIELGINAAIENKLKEEMKNFIGYTISLLETCKSEEDIKSCIQSLKGLEEHL